MKLLRTVPFIPIIISLYIIIITPPAPGYEISIYDAYPQSLWLLIISSITSGMYILVHQSFAKQKSNLWLTGFSAILLSNFIVLLLPTFRGYALYGRTDVVSHLGHIKDILSSGNVGKSNYYPISHILVTITSLILASDPKLIINIFTGIYNIFYSVGIFLLARAVAKSSGQALMVTAFGMPLLLTYYCSNFVSTALSFMIIPFVLYLHRKRMKASAPSTLLFIIFILLIPFFHPLTSIYLTVTFLVFGVSVVICNLLRGYKEYPLRGVFVPALIVFVTFFIWFSSFALFTGNVVKVWSWLTGEFGKPPIEMYRSILWEKAKLTVYEFTELLIKLQGHDLLYSALSLIAILIIIRKTFSKSTSLNVEEAFFSLIFMFFGLQSLLFLFKNIGTSGTPFRDFMWALMGSTILNGMVFHEWISTKWLNQGREYGKPFALKKNMFVCFLTLILTLASVIGVFNIYHSPIIKTANSQITHAELTGCEWLIKMGNPNIKITFIDELGRRLPDCLLGYEESRLERRVGHQAPQHFGYTLTNSIANISSSDTFLVISDYDMKFYAELWPERGSFFKSDFNMLSNDAVANRIHDNGDFEVLCIRQSLRP